PAPILCFRSARLPAGRLRRAPGGGGQRRTGVSGTGAGALGRVAAGQRGVAGGVDVPEEEAGAGLRLGGQDDLVVGRGARDRRLGHEDRDLLRRGGGGVVGQEVEARLLAVELGDHGGRVLVGLVVGEDRLGRGEAVAEVGLAGGVLRPL